MPKRPDPYLVDEENPEATAEDFRQMRPASEVLPRTLYESLLSKYDARQSAEGDRRVKELGLDDRHRDKDGRIQQKRSDTLNKNLSHPIPGFSPDITLGEMRQRTGQMSEKGVRQEVEKKVR